MLELLKQFSANDGFVNCPSYKFVSTCANVLCQLEESLCGNGWPSTRMEILGEMLKNVHCLDAELDEALFKLVY